VITNGSKTRAVQLGDFLTLKVVTDPRPSPDGSRVVLALQEVDVSGDGYRSHLWLVDGSESRPLTRGKVNDRSARWSPDGRRIAFVSDRGDEQGIWLLDLDGGEPRRLHSWKNMSPTGLTWSPRGDRLAFLGVPRPAKPEGDQKTGDGGLKLRRIQRPMYRFDGSGWLADERTHIFLIDVPDPASGAASPEPRRLTTGPAEDGPPAWSPDGTEIAYSCLPGNSTDEVDLSRHVSQVQVIAADGSGEPRRITLRDGGWSGPVWSPDGRWIAVTGTTHTEDTWGSNAARLWLYSAAGSEGVCLTPDVDRPVEDLSATDLSESFQSTHLFTPDGSELLFPLSDRGKVALWRVGVNPDGRRGSSPIPIWDGPALVTDFQLAGETLVGLLSDALTPHEVFAARYRPGDERITHATWTAFNREWREQLALVEPREFEARAEDGQTVHGWYLPAPNRTAGTHPPALLQIHGGPHVQYAWTFMFEFQYLASLGYTVIYCNPRGSQGYGDDFALPVREEFGLFAARDLHAALDHVIAAGEADPDRIGVLGGSGGGYLTTWLVAHSDRFRAGCSQRALNDWRSFALSSDIGSHSDWYLGSQPWEDGERYRSQSPLVSGDRIRTPLLIVHSEQDMRCQIEQAEQLYVWLRWQRCPVEFLRFPEESHGLSRMGTPSRRLERLRLIVEWFGKYMEERGGTQRSTATLERK